jgi:hypothetical protein
MHQPFHHRLFASSRLPQTRPVQQSLCHSTQDLLTRAIASGTANHRLPQHRVVVRLTFVAPQPCIRVDAPTDAAQALLLIGPLMSQDGK